LHNTHPARVSSSSPFKVPRARARGTPGLSNKVANCSSRLRAPAGFIAGFYSRAIDRATPRFHSRRRARAQLFMRNPLAASASSLSFSRLDSSRGKAGNAAALYNRAEMNASSNNVDAVSRVPGLLQRSRHYVITACWWRDDPFSFRPSSFLSKRREKREFRVASSPTEGRKKGNTGAHRGIKRSR